MVQHRLHKSENLGDHAALLLLLRAGVDMRGVAPKDGALGYGWTYTEEVREEARLRMGHFIDRACVDRREGGHTELYLRRVCGAGGFEALARAAPRTMPKLEKLNLVGTGMGPAEASAFFAVLTEAEELPKLRELDLGRNQLGAGGFDRGRRFVDVIAVKAKARFQAQGITGTQSDRHDFVLGQQQPGKGIGFVGGDRNFIAVFARVTRA